MNKSFVDNAIGNFVSIIEHLAQKLGIRVIKVNPKGTSQHCSRCLNRVTKTLSDRWHSCNSCGLSIDRDHNYLTYKNNNKQQQQWFIFFTLSKVTIT